MNNKIRTRFAPSPTGDPHIGNIRTALYAYLFARHEHGSFILRIEDTDKAREVPGSIDRIQESLRWLGLQWDEGPILQSLRLPLYKKHAETLIEKGYAYYCFCSTERLEALRKEQVQNGLPPMYNKHCRTFDTKEAKKRAQKEPHVIRLKIPEAGETVVHDVIRGRVTFQNNTVDDQVLLKSDGYPTYHLAVVVDDHDMNISHVIRAEDWLPSTPKHSLLYKYFDWDLPIFAHLSLIIGADKKKLSKRLGDMSLLSYKQQGYTPLAIINFLARLGFSPQEDRKLYTLEELAKEFSLQRLHKNPAIFDLEKLNWFNRLAKEQGQDSGGDLMEATKQTLQEHVVVSNPLTEVQYQFIKEAVKRIETVSDIENVLGYLWEEKPSMQFDLLSSTRSRDQKKDLLHSMYDVLQKIDDWQEHTIGNELRELAKSQKNVSSKDFYQLVTFAVTGSITSPPLFGSLWLLGKKNSLARIRKAITSLSF